MNDNTTVTSNDESRKEVKNGELKTNHVSDEEVRKSIEEWDDGKGIIIAAIAPEFTEIEITDQGESSSSNTGSTDGRRRKRVKVKVGGMASKGVIELITDPLVTVGTKKQNEKTEKARKNIKTKQAKKEEQEKE